MEGKGLSEMGGWGMENGISLECLVGAEQKSRLYIINYHKRLDRDSKQKSFVHGHLNSVSHMWYILRVFPCFDIQRTPECQAQSV